MKRVEVSEEAFRKGRLVAPVIYQKHVKGDAEVGELVEVETEEGKFCALWDATGPVRLRILFWHECPGSVEEAIREVITKSFEVRRRNGAADWDAYRLVNSDGDSFPGLIVDVYKDLAVLQSSSLAVDKHLMKIASIVKEITGVEAVAEKSSQRVRAKVGLPLRERMLIGNKKETVVDEEGVKFKVSLEGQKTGLYLDQRENRVYSERFAAGSKFLDAFSYTGGFGLHALKAGAREVTFVDEDPWALKVLKENLRLNNFDERKVKIVRSDAWKFFERAIKRGTEFDVGSVDPPALMDDYRDGYARYVRAFSGAAETIRSLAVLSSCSRSMDRNTFLKAIHQAAAPNYRILELRGSAPDHSVRLGLEDYLKVAFVYLR